MDTIISGIKTAYCPNYGCERAIYLRLRKHIMFGSIGFEPQQFECDDKSECEYTQQVEFCPFLREITNRYSSWR